MENPESTKNTELNWPRTGVQAQSTAIGIEGTAAAIDGAKNGCVVGPESSGVEEQASE